MANLKRLLYVLCICDAANGEMCNSDDECSTGQASTTLLQVEAPVLVSKSEASTCIDYTEQYNSYDDKKAFGARDKDGDPCSFYVDHMGECGKHDDDDFIAGEMCCSCNGGSNYMGKRSLAVNNASVFLSEGSDCPGGYEPVATLAACRAALDMVGISGLDFNGFDSESDWPKGCYYCKNTDDCGDGVWFNTHGSGNIVPGTRRFCQKNYDPSAVKILFVGDSDIDYWDSAVNFPGSFNVGIGGYTTGDVKKEVNQWVEELNPKWVVIVCGENDINGGRKKTQRALNRFKAIVNKFIDDGSRVIYLGTKPEPDSKELFAEYKYYDEELRKFATWQAQGRDWPSFVMIDVFKSFTSDAALFNSDEVHMSRLGYKFWNGWVKLAMESKTACVRWWDGVCVEAPSP